MLPRRLARRSIVKSRLFKGSVFCLPTPGALVNGPVGAGQNRKLRRDAALPRICGKKYSSNPRHFSSVEQDDRNGLYGDQDFTWVDKYVFPALRPYLKIIRVDRPIGTLLLFWPCSWSIALAAPTQSLPDWWTLALFGTGAFIMRGAGCTINDIWDKDFDKKVERTKNRPLATGAISLPQAISFLGGQLGLGLGILLQLNDYSIGLGVSSLALVATYPLFKRITFYPQLVLGLAFNWGALLGWSAIHGDCDWSIVAPLYLSGISWTMVYDTWYAHQDKADDSKLGLKSTALAWGDSTSVYASGFASLMILSLGISGYSAGLEDSIVFKSGLATAAAHFLWQIKTADLNNRLNLNDRFRSNNILGAIVFASIVGGKFV